MPFSVNIQGSTMVPKMYKARHREHTIYAYLFMYVPQLYVCTIFPMIHVYERLDSSLEHHAIM